MTQTTTTGDRGSILSASTLVPLGLIVAVTMSAISGTWLLANGFAELRKDITERDSSMALRLQKIELKLDAIESNGSDIWTRSQMETYVEAMRAQNPTLKFPDVGRIR